MSTGKIRVRRDGDLLWMTIDNQDKRNAMSLSMYQQLLQHCREADADEEVRVVVLHGAGSKAFMSGADMSEFDSQRSNEEQVARYREISSAGSAALRALRKPTVAMIQGWCAGGGLGIALTCDLRVCSADARFFNPTARLAQGFTYESVRSLIQLIGAAAAREVLLTGRQYDAEDALRIGLVHRVVPAEEIEAYVTAYAGDIAASAPLSIASCKAAIAAALAEPDARDLSACEELHHACFTSEDYSEARRAFAEKRKPRYVGR